MGEVNMIWRCFQVRASSEELLCNIDKYVEEKLNDLQNWGWEIINVFPITCKEYRYPKYYDSIVYNIIAKYNDDEEKCKNN